MAAAHRVRKPSRGLRCGRTGYAKMHVRRPEGEDGSAKSYESGALQSDAVISDRHIDGGLDRSLLFVRDRGERGKRECQLDAVGRSVGIGQVKDEQSARSHGESAAGARHGDKKNDHDDARKENDTGLDGDPGTEAKIQQTPWSQ